MVPIEFVLFALTLFGVALFHRYTLQVALIGLAAITLALGTVYWLMRERDDRSGSPKLPPD